MSIYIKGVNLPEQGVKTLLVWYNGDVTDGQAQDIGKAAELSPHGALGDLDALLAEIKPDRPEDFEQAVTIHVLKKVLRNHINNAPVVIPASGGEEADPADPVDPVVAEALKHGFYGTMYGHPGEKVIFIKPGEAWESNGILYFRWGYPGPDVNAYKQGDYGKTWAMMEYELTDSISEDWAEEELT